MDKRVEKMRETITNRNKALLGLICLTNAFGLIMRRDSVVALAKTQAQGDFVQGFVTGVVIAMDLLLVALLVKNYAALKDEKKLARLYNEMNDEREIKIEALAGKAALKFGTVLAALLSIVVAVFVSTEAALSIIGALSIMAVIKVISRVYYTRTYTGE
ncbi:hypothetical protein [Butyrivibrio sp. WCD3002]|jgi:hypothetical protein|uniref:hypothetical protein n=1 Tax=Butyrivibrio sp. WCD3002 TaxID=1280676 RepID=UPI00040875A4|nr:hypothetical protein [Butyrivibrio sp. WCD3002]